MSFSIPFSDMSEKIKKRIKKYATIKFGQTQYEGEREYKLWKVDKDRERVNIPIGLWSKFYHEFPTLDTESIRIDFGKTLYTLKTDPDKWRDQDIVVKQALTILREKRSILLDLPTGFGKTGTGAYIIRKLARKSLIICQFKPVLDQWVDEMINVCNCKVQSFVQKKGNIISEKGGNRLNPDADIYVMTLIKASKFTLQDWQTVEIGTVIYDECHASTFSACSELLLNIEPQYLIGLTATPDKDDKREKLYIPYFGESDSYIHRVCVKNFTVIKYVTGIKPEEKYCFLFGKRKLDWNVLLNSIESNEQVFKIAGKIASEWHPSEKILIICNRKVCVEGIVKECERLDLDVCAYYDNATSYRQEARVLVVSQRKAGVGFNDPTRTIGIMVSDCRDNRQYEGRMRTMDFTIYDLVHDNNTLEKHWQMREEWYNVRGAKIDCYVEGAGYVKKQQRRGKKINIPQERVLQRNTN